MQSQQVFGDYNYSGSGLNVLLDVLSYNTYYGAYFVNMLASEIGISTAVIRDNINRLAKALNYTPQSMVAATAYVNITVTPPVGNTPPGSLVINSYTPFISSTMDGVNYTFNTTTAQVAYLANGTFSFSNVAIQEGDVTNYLYTANTINSRNIYNIPSANIDLSTLVVSITENSVPPQTFPYLYSTDVSLLTGNSRVYFLDGAESSTYNLYFGDGVLGRSLQAGETVALTYINTNGDFANQANNFTIISPVASYGNVITTSIQSASGGAQAESNDSIRQNAPLAYTTQERAVTLDDYIFLLQRDYKNIGSISAWGGDKNVPPVYGTIFVAIKPTVGNYLTNIQKNQILATLSQYNLPTTNVQIIDPDYTYMLFSCNVNYDPNKTLLTQTKLQNVIRTAIIQYGANNLGSFTSTFRNSDLADAIKTADPSILGADNTIFLQKRFFPVLNTNYNYTLQYYSAIKQGTLYNTPIFTVLDNNGNNQKCLLEENVNTFKGISSYVITNPGFGYTSPPTITISGDGAGATAVATIVNGAIQSITITNPGEGYNIAAVTISGGGGYGAQIAPILTNGQAVLDTYYLSNSTKFYITTNQGSIDYINGTIILNNFNPTNVLNTSQNLAINIQPATNFIFPTRNNILLLDQTDPLSISINLIPQPT